MSSVKNVAIQVVSAQREMLEPLLYHSIFSNPLTLGDDTPLSSLVERSREKDIGAKDWFGKV